ncbi:hypothetical protein GCM10028816_35900 [Spirosoma lituiforme]
MLYMHLRGNVIGKWENLRKENGVWLADAVFDVADTRPGGGAEIGGKVDREFINAASIGIVILEATYNEALDCYDITKWSMQEISIVDIGSNQNALQLYDKSGEPLSEMKLAAHLEQFKPDNSQANPINSMKQIALTTIALAMGLTETATEQEVMILAANNLNLAKELSDLKLQIAKDKTTEATNLVDEAVNDKRIPATAKDSYLKLFSADHESTKAILAGMVKPQNLVTLAAQGAAQAATVTDADAANKYDEMDRAGTLLQLKTSNPDEFKRLYKSKFGKEPDKVFA